MTRPNIILLTVDGMRWDDMGASGNPDIRTPNLDALASHGLSFVQAFTCRPHAPQQPPVPCYIEPTVAGGEGGADDPLVAPVQRAGYETGAVGAVTEGPCDYLARTGAGVADDAYTPWLESAEAARLESSGAGDALHVNTWTGSQAVRFCQSGTEPFFLWAGFSTAPEPPPPWRTMYAPESLHLPEDPAAPDGGERARTALAAHYGALSHIDRQIGRMLATLTARGRTNNLIAVTASRGSGAGYVEEPDPFHDAYIHVPLIIGGHRGQRKGEREPALVSLADIPETLLAALNMPGGPGALPQLHRAGAAHRKAVAIRGPGGARALRTARYKWVIDEGAGTERLYDLQNDPRERKNIGDTRQALAIRRMLEGLARA